MSEVYPKEQYARVAEWFRWHHVDNDEARQTIMSALDLAAKRASLLEEAMMVVEPFAVFAVTAENFVAARAKDNGSPVLPTNNFRLSHFKAASDLYSKLKAAK